MQALLPSSNENDPTQPQPQQVVVVVNNGNVTTEINNSGQNNNGGVVTVTSSLSTLAEDENNEVGSWKPQIPFGDVSSFLYLIQCNESILYRYQSYLYDLKYTFGL